MKGLIRRDFKELMGSKKWIFFVVYFCSLLALSVGSQFSGNMGGVMIVFGAVISMSLFNFDTYYHWNAFAVTMPMGRKKIVIARYISALVLMLICMGCGFCFLLGKYLTTGAVAPEELWMMVLLSEFAVFYLSLELPVQYAFGATWGRIVVLASCVLLFGVAGACIAIFGTPEMENIHEVAGISTAVLAGGFAVFDVLALALSVQLSGRIYKRKDF